MKNYKGIIDKIQSRYACCGNNYIDLYAKDFRHEGVRYEFGSGYVDGEYTIENYDDLLLRFNESNIKSIQLNKKFLGKEYDTIIRLKDGTIMGLYSDYSNEY